MDNIMKDKRFSRILKDPRFKKMPTIERKTKIDKRFQGMFNDENFKLKYAMDKRGRPWKHTTSEDLKKFYSVHSDDEESDEAERADSDQEVKDESKQESDSKETLTKVNVADDSQKPTPSTEDSEDSGKEEADDDSEEEEEDGDDSSDDSTSSEELGDDDGIEDDFDHKWEELDADAPVAPEVTKRLAVCNMDWDRIRAQDILAVFSSFAPAGSVVHSVKIYPSEFGLKRMEEETIRGPTELVTHDKNAATEEKDEKSQYHREKLRQYQINRLKYYYAVVECDTPETANSLYEQLNGMEYESSAVCMDIRFVPDDMTFDQKPKCVAESIPDPTQYKPRLFVTTALQQVKVNLTWDETDPSRKETLQRAFKEPDNIENDLKAYLASSSSESEAENEDQVLDSVDTVVEDESSGKSRKMKMEDRIAAYKSLLQSLKDKEKDKEEEYDMEITWEPGLKEKTKEMVKEKLGQTAPLTPFEEQLKKRKEGKKIKKIEKRKQNENISDSEEESADEDRVKPCTADELALLMSDNDDSDDDNRRKRKNKNKKLVEEKNDGFEVNTNDNRFSAVYTSHLFNIDPSDPHFKDSKGMQAIIQAKQRKRHRHDDSSIPSDGQKKEKTYLTDETTALMNSIKRKTKKKIFK